MAAAQRTVFFAQRFFRQLLARVASLCWPAAEEKQELHDGNML